MAHLENILHNINPEGVSTLEECKEIFIKFFHNFTVILKGILVDAGTKSGYSRNSPIFALEPISDSKFTNYLQVTTNNYLTEDMFLNWPDKLKGSLLKTLFTHYKTNNKFYSRFIQNFKAKKDEWKIESLFEDCSFLEYRTSILNLEKAIIMTLNRSNLSNVEEDYRKTLQSQAASAATEDTALEAFWNTLVNEGEEEDLKEEYLTELTEMVFKVLDMLIQAAETYNILKTLIPPDITADSSKFLFPNYNEYMVAIPNILIHLQTTCGKIESKTFQGQKKKIKFSDHEKYTKAIEDLKLGQNFKFKVQTNIPDIDLKLTAVESTNIKVTSPRSESPKPIIKITKEENVTSSGTDSDTSSDNESVISVKTKDSKSKKKARGAKYEMAIKNLTKSMIRVQSALNSEDDLKKTKAQNLLSEIKNATEMARNVLYKTSGDKDTGRKLEQTIDSALEMMDNLTEILDSIHSQDQLRSSLPKGSFPVWNGDAEGYLNFKKTILPHLESLTTEPLKLSTLKNQMTGHICEKIKRKLYNITTLDKFIEELDKRYGDLEKILPDKLKEMNKLKPNPRSKLQELTNVTALLSYVRVCESFDGLSNINLLWVTQYAFYLTESNACKLLATKGKPDKVIPLLEQISEEDESYNDIQPKTYNRDGYSPDWKNNGLRAKNYNGLECFICQGEHKFTYCPLLDSRKTMEEREKAILDRGLCLRCLYKWHPDHTCKNEERRFNCPMHQRNYNICKCGKNSDQLSEGKIESD